MSLFNNNNDNINIVNNNTDNNINIDNNNDNDNNTNVNNNNDSNNNNINNINNNNNNTNNTNNNINNNNTNNNDSNNNNTNNNNTNNNNSNNNINNTNNNTNNTNNNDNIFITKLLKSINDKNLKKFKELISSCLKTYNKNNKNNEKLRKNIKDIFLSTYLISIEGAICKNDWIEALILLREKNIEYNFLETAIKYSSLNILNFIFSNQNQNTNFLNFFIITMKNKNIQLFKNICEKFNIINLVEPKFLSIAIKMLNNTDHIEYLHQLFDKNKIISEKYKDYKNTVINFFTPYEINTNNLKIFYKYKYNPNKLLEKIIFGMNSFSKNNLENIKFIHQIMKGKLDNRSVDQCLNFGEYNILTYLCENGCNYDGDLYLLEYNNNNDINENYKNMEMNQNFRNLYKYSRENNEILQNNFKNKNIKKCIEYLKSIRAPITIYQLKKIIQEEILKSYNSNQKDIILIHKNDIEVENRNENENNNENKNGNNNEVENKNENDIENNNEVENKNENDIENDNNENDIENDNNENDIENDIENEVENKNKNNNENEKRIKVTDEVMNVYPFIKNRWYNSFHEDEEITRANGIELHKQIEDYLKYSKLPLVVENTKFKSFLNFKKDNIKLVLGIEEYVKDDIFSGKIDSVIVNKNNQTVIVDWKSCHNIDKIGYDFDHKFNLQISDFNRYVYQLHLYYYLYKKKYSDKKIDLLWIVQFYNFDSSILSEEKNNYKIIEIKVENFNKKWIEYFENYNTYKYNNENNHKKYNYERNITLDFVIDFGKYNGKKLSEIPLDYLKYLCCFEIDKNSKRVINSNLVYNCDDAIIWLYENKSEIINIVRMYVDQQKLCMYCFKNNVKINKIGKLSSLCDICYRIY